MEKIINEITEELKRELIELFCDNPSLGQVEEYVFTKMKAKAVLLTEAYAFELNTAIHSDKAGRKKAGMVIERCRDKRTVLSTIGEIHYERDYYHLKNGTYSYPVDQILEVDNYQRITSRTGVELAREAMKHAYSESSRIVTEGKVSRQTVMNALRRCEAVPYQEDRLRKVPVLHIDADEDHVNLQNGKNRIVPLVSVYEGIEPVGHIKSKRHRCENVFHYSESRYHEDFWDNVLIEIRKRYDLEGTKVYLHGDGAAWIKEGIEHFRDCVYVLDGYHRNKATKAVFAGVKDDEGIATRMKLNKALRFGDPRLLGEIRNQRIRENPEYYKRITEAIAYLANNLDGITIRYKDPEALNGGATEPHVSHVLSSRLSSRPMGWSDKTLKVLVPALASGALRLREDPVQGDHHVANEVISAAMSMKQRKLPGMRKRPAYVDPENCSRSRVLMNGEVTPLYRVIHALS